MKREEGELFFLYNRTRDMFSNTNVPYFSNTKEMLLNIFPPCVTHPTEMDHSKPKRTRTNILYLTTDGTTKDCFSVLFD